MATATRRQIAAYAEGGPWKVDHDAAMACRDVEDCLEIGICLYRRIVEIESRNQELALSGRLPDVEACLKEVDDLYRMWHGASRKWLADIEALAARGGFNVDGLGAFRAAVEEAGCVIGNNELEPQIHPFEELLTIARPDNPRPDRYRD